MYVRLLNQMEWNIELIQVLCSAEWRSAFFYPVTRNRYKYSLWFHIPHWQHPDELCVCVYVLCICVKRQWEKDCCCMSVGQACLRAQGFTTWLYTCITHLAGGYTSRFKVNSNISLSETQLKKPQNTPITVRTNRSPCPAMWGPLTERTNTIEGLFLPEQAKGRTDDKRSLDGRQRTEGAVERTREGDRIRGGQYETKKEHKSYFNFPFKNANNMY